LEHYVGALPEFENREHVDVVGLITQNPLYWESRYGTVRVYGNHESLVSLVHDDDRISVVLFVAPERLTWSKLQYFAERIDKLRLTPAVIDDSRLTEVSVEQLMQRAGYPEEQP
jgi:FlaA1/EpsC-like NDP-sugar epimerase